MKTLKIIFALLFAFSCGAVNALEVLGLKICGNTSINQVKNMLKSKGASISEETIDAESGAISLITKDFTIVDAINEVSFEIYRGKLYRIEIKDAASITPILAGKYGILTEKETRLGASTEILSYYNSRDINVDISSSMIYSLSASKTAEVAATVKYLCLPIYKQLLTQLEKSKNNYELQIKGANKL
jgi:hypothetical protein